MNDARLDCAGVLVVEDDADILRALVQVLKDEGYAVRVAENGRVALSALRAPESRLPCLILLDLMMPVMDGWAFRAEQLRDPILASIPVIVLTANASGAQRASTMTGVATLQKPIELSALLAVVAPFVG